ncbi:YybH family protein [Microbacterium sp. As-52]|uniref:YybH family protein n=1 Tax=Microbacterium sp. As-52 TaxID=3390503 RepID=UPI003CECD7AF
MTEPVMDLATVHLVFMERFNAGDIDGLLAMNAPDVVFVPVPGEPVSEPEEVRAGLEQFLGLGGQIRMTPRHVFVSGAVGLVISDWALDGAAPDGSPISLAGSTSDVAVFDETHGWRVAIDNPFGTA